MKNGLILILGFFLFCTFAVINYKTYFKQQELKGVSTKVKLLSFTKSSKRKNRICVDFRMEKRCLNVSDGFLNNIEKKDSVVLLYDSFHDVLYDKRLNYRSQLYVAHLMLGISVVILLLLLVLSYPIRNRM